MDHDTQQIRSAARRIGSVASSVKSISSKDLGDISNSIPPYFKGEAADALQSIVLDLIKDMNGLSEGLRSIQDTLNSYAAALDRADAEAAKAIKET